MTTTRAFTALSLITLLTSPLIQLLINVMPFVAAIGCFDRVRVFLESDPRKDRRETVMIDYDSSMQEGQLTVSMTGKSILEVDDSGVVSSDSEKRLNSAEKKNSGKFSNRYRNSPALQIQGGTFGWVSKQPVVHNIDLSVEFSQLALLIGPTSSGKSTLLKAILGEVPFSEGSITISSRHSGVAFCDQIPWLSNISVQQTILGFAQMNKEWYDNVARACCLEDDLQTLPNGDQSLVGSGGFSFTGGQRQRLVRVHK